jgi:hypothetical protein
LDTAPRPLLTRATFDEIAARRHLLLPIAAALALLAIAVLDGGGEPLPSARATPVATEITTQLFGCGATP